MATCGPTEEQKAELASLRAARIKLAAGTHTSVVVDSNGERVEFTRASLADLKSLIRELEWEYGIKTVSRPLKVIL